MKLFSLLILFSSIFAQSPFDWDENGIPLRQGTHIEWWKAVEVGNEGEFIIVWSDCRYGIRDIFAQKITAEGELLWGTDGDLVALEDGLRDGITIAQANGRQEDPIIITDEQGGFYMMWMDYRDEPAQGDIYGQHVMADGSLQFGIEGVALTNLPGKQSSPNMCKDNLGGVFAIWKDQSDGSSIIKGTHISFDGTILNPGEGIVINNSTHSKGGISLEVIGDGLAGMTWARTIPVGPGEEDNEDIVIQIMNVNLETQLTTTDEGGVIICNTPFIQTAPKVTYVNGEQFVVTWQDHRTPENFGDIYMQYFDLQGNPLLSENGIGISVGEGEQKRPRAKGDATGSYFVWQDYRNNADNPDIYIQKVALDGSMLLTENGERITAFEEASQINPRLTVDGNGGAYFIWEDYRNGDFPEVDIYIQHLNATNQFSFETNGLLVNAENSISPVLKKDGTGGVFAAWDDYRIGSNSIYLQRITPENGVHYEENGMKVFAGITGNVGDSDTDVHASSLYTEDGKTLVYWIDNRWAPDLQEVTFGMLIDQNFNDPVNWSNGVPLSLNASQGDPQIAYLNGKYLLTFMVESEYTSIYYLTLDSQLNYEGDGLGVPLFNNTEWSMVTPKVIAGEDDHFYIAYAAKEHGPQTIFLQKFTDNGVPVWEDNGIEISDYSFGGVEHFLVDIQPNPGGGAIISWLSASWMTGYNVYAKAVDSDGNTVEGWDEWGTNLVTDSGTKNNPIMLTVGNNVFCAWEDNRNFDNGKDLYGQLISLDGQILGPEEGIEIIIEDGDQDKISSIYNSNDNKIFSCWNDYRSGANFNIYCNVLDLESLQTENEVLISDDIGDQISPDVAMASDGSYLVVWEDERNSPTDSEAEVLEKDVYFQQILNGEPVYENNGYPLCDQLYKQSKPIIFPQTPQLDAFYMVWMDLRSTGKEDLKNIYSQAITINETVESITDNSHLPTEFKINNIFPNPFNPATTISYETPEIANIKIEVVNLLGQTVDVLIDDIVNAGSHSINWEPNTLSSGSYLVRVNYNGELNQTQKIMLVK